jgi:serine/threonine-protein kinase
MRGKLLGGRYQVEEVLANGGFGQTYVAQDMHRPGSPQCVVKHLQPAGINSGFMENARRLFQTEAEILEKLGNHDQIPRLLAYFEENQEFYLVQEFIQGHTLTAELQPGDRLSENEVYQLLQQVLKILVFVHSYGVIHRDIKPDNLIRRQHDGKLVLVDFGSVKQAWTQVITNQGQTSVTFAHNIPATIAIGTPGYMPTEQGRGRPRPNSDIYALGMIAIQAVTGTNPTQLIEDSDNGEIGWRHRAKISEGLASVLTKMVRYHFKNRYQTAKEALEALDQLPQLELEAGSQRQHHPRQITSLSAQHRYKLSTQNIVLVTLRNSQTNVAGKADSGGITTATTVNVNQATVFSPLEPQATNNSQNIVPDATGNLSATQTKSHHRAAIPVTPKHYRLRIGAAITAVLMSMAAIYAIDWPPLASTQRTQDRIAPLKAEEIQECVSGASTPTSDSQSNTNTQALLYKCLLASSKQLAASKNFHSAIAQVSKIPLTDASYAEAEQLITQWSNSMLEIAKNQYYLGQMDRAIAQAQSIPKTSSVYQKAQQSIKQWHQEWEKNNSSWQAANSALAAGRWQDALNAAKLVIDTPYWQKKTEPIIQKAEAKIATSKTVVNSQPKPAVRIKRTPSKQATRPVTKSKISTKPRRVTVVTRRHQSVTQPRSGFVVRPTRAIPKRLPPSLTKIPVRTTKTPSRNARFRVSTQRTTRIISKRSTRIIKKRVIRSTKVKRSYRWVTKTLP